MNRVDKALQELTSEVGDISIISRKIVRLINENVTGNKDKIKQLCIEGIQLLNKEGYCIYTSKVGLNKIYIKMAEDKERRIEHLKNCVEIVLNEIS